MNKGHFIKFLTLYQNAHNIKHLPH